MEINRVYETRYAQLSSSVAGVKQVPNTAAIKGLRDTVEISSKGKVAPAAYGLDKGTASHTTIYVDQASYDKICNYVTTSPDYEWEEMGWDGEKKWIVINGQRFEYKLSEEEKKQIEKAKMTLIDYIQEEEEKREALEEIKQEVKIPLEENDELRKHPKIKNLEGNEIVMKVLGDLAKTPGGIKLYI